MQKFKYSLFSLLSFLIFLGVITLDNSCKFLNLSEESGSEIPFTYGLYDDFESDSINKNLWYHIPRQQISIKDEGTGNHICEIWTVKPIQINAHLDMIWPYMIFPDEFDGLSAKVRLSSASYAEDFCSGIAYNVDLVEKRNLAWITEIGIRNDSAGYTYLFAQWKNYNTREVFHKDLGEAKLDTWYKLEMKIIKLNSFKLKIEYYVNDTCLAESIPPDSAILLDHNKIESAKRSLHVYTKVEASGRVCGWFDDVWGVYGDAPAEYLMNTQSTEPPSIFEGIFDPSGINQTLIERKIELQETQRQRRLHEMQGRKNKK